MAIGKWLINIMRPLYGYTDSGIETIPKNYNRDGIVLSREQVSTMRNNFQATLNYSKRFADKHYVAAILGTQLENYSIKNVFARRTNPPKEGLTQVDGERKVSREREILKVYAWHLILVD